MLYSAVASKRGVSLMTDFHHTTLSRVETAYVERKRRVLIADDDESMRRMLAESLEQEGYQVQQAADGRQALETASSFLPDLVLLDVKMPAIARLQPAR